MIESRQRRYAIVALIALSFAASSCDQPRSSASTVTDRERLNEEAAATASVAQTEASVKLDVALRRIDQLEREVAELKAGPTAVDNDMLRQRLAITEDALARRDAPEPTPTPTSTAAKAPGLKVASPRKAPAATPQPIARSTSSPRARRTASAQAENNR